MAMMTVYHGGYEPVKNPEIRKGRNTKDFGSGFYCTVIKEQAQRWARRYDTKVVSIYDVRLNTDLKIKEFKEMTEEWLDFIVACRLVLWRMIRSITLYLIIWTERSQENNSGFWQSLNTQHIKLHFAQKRH